ncbi:hypothetical protein BGZ76_003035 [Entomortierella beljakovae]|nr:hypothetical protein BGZ76_003035 [Entomortierella beljakovae]
MPKESRSGPCSGCALHNRNLINEHRHAIWEHKRLNPKLTYEELQKQAVDGLHLARQPAQRLSNYAMTQRRVGYIEHPRLDEALTNWVLQLQALNCPVSRTSIYLQGQRMAIKHYLGNKAPKLGSSSLNRFNKRWDFKIHQLHGESASEKQDKGVVYFSIQPALFNRADSPC